MNYLKDSYIYGMRLALIVSLLCFCLCTLTFAAEWRFIPGLGLYAGYDDNVLFSNVEKISSSVINIEPSIELDYRTLRSSLEFSADFDILRFLEASDLDRVNQYYRLNANYQLGERWDVRARVNYFNDTTLNTYLEETGRVILRVGRDYLRALGGLTYNISNSSWLDTYYQYEKATYESDIFSTYDRNRLNLYYSHRLKSERDVLSVGPSFYHRNSDVNDTDYISLDVVWDRDWSEITKSSAGIGPRYTMVDNDIGDDKDVWGVKAKLDITHLGIASKLELRYFHDLRTLAAGTDVNVDNLFLRYNYSLTQRFNLGIQGRLIFSYSLFELEEDTDNENRFFSIEPFLGYQLLEKLNVSLRYRYGNNSRDLVDSEETKERNLVWIQFNYAYPMMF